MDFQPIIDALAKKGADIHVTEIGGLLHAAVPEGITLQRLDLEPYLPAPLAIRRVVAASDLRGLIDYVKKFKTGDTQFYSSPLVMGGNLKLLARMDDHLPDSPSHINHTVEYPCPTSAEWRTWIGSNKTAMDQKKFADFLETNLRDILVPSGADMLQMASNFRDVSSAEFNSAVNRTNGRVNFQWIEKDVVGKAQLPEDFQIAIPVFEGMTENAAEAGQPSKMMALRYALKARLRWRVKDAELSLWYELDRHDLTFRLAFDDLIERVHAETGISVFRAI